MSEWIANLRRKNLFQWGAQLTSRIAVPAMDQAEWLRFLFDLGMGFLLSQASLFFGGASLAVAWVGARLLWERWPVGAVAGILLGLLARWMPLGWANGWQVAACALLLSLQTLRWHIKATGQWSMSLMVGVVLALPCPFLWPDSVEMIFCLCTAAMAGVMVPVYDRVIGILRHREHGLTWDDRLCLLLSLVTLVLGGSKFSAFGVDLGNVLAVLCVTALAWCSGAGASIVCGAVMGLALALNGDVSSGMIALSACGLMSSVLQNTRKIWAAGGCLLGNGLIMVCFSLAGVQHLAWANMVLGLGVFLLIPDPTWAWIKELLAEMRLPEATPGGIAIQWLQTSASALESMADALPEVREEPSDAIEQLAIQLCEGCMRQQDCWDEKYGETFALMDDLLEAARQESLQPRELSHMARVRNCQRPDLLPEILFSVCRAEERQAHFRAQQQQASHLAKVQLRSQAGLMQSLCGHLAQSSAAGEGERMAIARALAHTPWRSSTALPYRMEGLLQILLIPPDHEDLGEAPLHQLEETLRMRLVAEPLWEGLVCLRQLPSYRLEMGVATQPAQGQEQNGDSWITGTLPRGIQLLALSDGMGKGEGAGEESTSTLNLLKQGFEAGYSRKELLNLINDLMRSCHGEERYSTVDLCLIDLKNGESTFEKLGACASFLLRDGKCRRLMGGTLPMGILEEVIPRSFHMQLLPGDLLIMVSDGIADVFEEDRALLKALTGLPQEPQTLADGLLKAALIRSGGVPKDDMTVVAARLEQEATFKGVKSA